MISEVHREVLDEAERLIKGKVHALIAYGSQVAGYARPDSDYDYLLIAEGFRQRVRYYYKTLPSGRKASYLVVNRRSFEKDVDRAHLGEFVAGRLYGIYEPILNSEYVRGQEKALKLRTISEELIDLCGEFEGFLPHLVIPLRYFLYSKLKKRMVYYPPLKYSYYETFFGLRGGENTEASLTMFREAAEELALRGVLEFEGDTISIRDPGVSRAHLEKLLQRFHLFYRGVKAYFVHAWAGKVGIKVVIDEFSSKFFRGIDGTNAPEVIRTPSNLLRLKERDVRFYYDEVPLQKVFEDYLGSQCEGFEKSKGPGFFSLFYKVSLKATGRTFNFALKKYSEVEGFKWLPIELYMLTAVSFALAPKARLNNEYTYSQELRRLGFNAPQTVAVLWRDKSLVMEFIEGTMFSDLISEGLGEAELEKWMGVVGYELASLHNHGLCLVDSKPQNILVAKDGRIFFTDLEQAKRGGDPAWDIALLLFYSAKFTLKVDRILRAFKAFTKAYVAYGRATDVARAASERYVRVFLPLVLPDTLTAMVKFLRSYRKK